MHHTSTSAILKNLTLKMNELKRIQGQSQVMGKWAHAFLETCLGFDAHRDYRVSYSSIGQNWRPTMVIAREGVPFCTFEVGRPPLRRYHHIPYGLLFTGTEWRLYDLSSDQGPSLMAICDLSQHIAAPITEASVTELEKELTPFHETAFLSKVWETLAEEARKCSTDSVTKVLLSKDVLELIQARLGVERREPSCHKLLHYKVVDMLQAETPVRVKHTKIPGPSSAA